VLSEDVLWPNGIGVAPDGRTVYLSDYAHQAVLVASTEGLPVREFARMPGVRAENWVC